MRLEVPAYGRFVDAEIAKHGRLHLFIRMQYFCETIDAEGGMFTPARRALMQGKHPKIGAPSRGSNTRSCSILPAKTNLFLKLLKTKF